MRSLSTCNRRNFAAADEIPGKTDDVSVDPIKRTHTHTETLRHTHTHTHRCMRFMCAVRCSRNNSASLVTSALSAVLRLWVCSFVRVRVCVCVLVSEKWPMNYIELWGSSSSSSNVTLAPGQRQQQQQQLLCVMCCCHCCFFPYATISNIFSFYFIAEKHLTFSHCFICTTCGHTVSNSCSHSLLFRT